MNVVIFDLDETVIDSRHRTPNNPDGTLNLQAYIEKHTPENVARDTLLPLADVMRACYTRGDYVVVLTARDMKPCDYDFLAAHGLHYNLIMSRDRAKPKHYALKDGEYKKRWVKPLLNLRQFKNANIVMFDDAKPVKENLRELFPVICAHKANKRLAKIGAR